MYFSIEHRPLIWLIGIYILNNNNAADGKEEGHSLLETQLRDVTEDSRLKYQTTQRPGSRGEREKEKALQGLRKSPYECLPRMRAAMSERLLFFPQTRQGI